MARRVRLVPLGVLGFTTLAAACGPGALPGAGGPRESGQSRLMDDTFAGRHRCSPESHERPFVIEWDATDMSSFEAHAAGDLVVVKYEGCSLKVLGACKDDSVRGALGAYRPPEWTSGSLEKLDVSSEGELYAKLPLGVATLGGRVQGGEKFHMEYYVAGTRSATRDALYEGDLAGKAGCQGATHFVYGYNLGAFALGSVTTVAGEAEGSLYGFGGGVKKSNTSKADKQGGDLRTCKGESARELEGCKVPIRLTLRKIAPGENPDAAARRAPDTSESVTAAGQVAVRLDMSEEARARYEAAAAKMNARDGKGCLGELDAHDRLNPKRPSTDPRSGVSHLRGQCLMLAGQCDAGKLLVRKTFEQNQSSTMTPEHLDRTVDGLASLYCQGGSMSPRDQLLKALQELQQGAYLGKKEVSFCKSAYQAVRRLAPTVKPRDDEDTQVIQGPKQVYHVAAQCLARAGDCAEAWKVFQEAYPPEALERVKDPQQREKVMKATFDSMVPKCRP